jgi:hypothetical protein
LFRHFLIWHGSLVASLYVPNGEMSVAGKLLNRPNRQTAAAIAAALRIN